MKKITACLPLLLFSLLPFASRAQIQPQNALEDGGTYPLSLNDASHPCITAEQYALIEKRCADNLAVLKPYAGSAENPQPVALAWPLKAAAGFNDCSFYTITAYVDQNMATSAISDYNCGMNTYDGHRGTDIAIVPYPFYKMDNNLVEVVAAAPGMIIDKSDGNFDKNCATNSLTANYLAIQQADGSTILYFHMKKNSLTAKTIGQTVATGEYLGVVGSSGNSSGPHLHFEVWSGSTNATRVDPYSGTCNLLNNTTWWAAQKPYTEPAIIKVSANTTDVVIPGCPTTETPNEVKCFSLPFQGPGLPAGYAKFYIFFRDETNGLSANMSILNPDGSTYLSWVYNSLNSYNFSYRGYSKTLPTTPGTYTFQATYNGITCSTTFDIVKATIAPSGPVTICQGNSTTLSASVGSTYLWSNGATTKDIIVSIAGNYTVTVTSATGCSSVSPATSVMVNPPPAATITPGGATTFCQGNSVMLTASGGTSYLWSTGATTAAINVSTTGNYKVTVTNASGCTAVSSATTVTVNPLPVATITPGGATTFCQGNSVTLTASGGTTYLWSTGATTAAINVSTTGNYKVTVTNASGCTAVSSATTITVNPLPVAIITPGGATTFCQGNSVTLTAGGGTSYLWSTGATTAIINVSTTGNYKVTVTNASGCSAVSSATTVTVNPLPVASITPGGATTFCQGNSVTLTASGGASYLWSTGATTAVINVSITGNYKVTVTNASGCSAVSAATTVQVNPLSVAEISPGGPTSFCQGNSVTLIASAGISYLWSTGATTQIITVSSTGNYVVTVANAFGCTAASTPVGVTVHPLPPVPGIVANGSTLSSSAGSGNQWLLNGIVIAGATGQTFHATQNGDYTVLVTDGNGCSASSAVFHLINTETTSVGENNAVIVMPNPTSGKFTVEIVKENFQLSEGVIEIFNLLGYRISMSAIRQPVTDIDISSQPAGVYFVRISSVNGKQMIKVLKI